MSRHWRGLIVDAGALGYDLGCPGGALDLLLAGEVDEDALLELAEYLAEYEAAVSGLGNDELSVTLSVTSVQPVDAGYQALNAVLLVLDKLHRRFDSTAAMEVLTQAEQNRRLAEPTIPALIGAAEVGELLGVSRQPVHQLHTENPRFPRPVVQVRMGPLWTRASVQAFAESWGRRPGRPSRWRTKRLAEALERSVTPKGESPPRPPRA